MYWQNKWVAVNYIDEKTVAVIESELLITREVASDTALKMQHYVGQDCIVNHLWQFAVKKFHERIHQRERTNTVDIFGRWQR